MNKILLIACMILSLGVGAQTDTAGMGADELYKLARERAFGGDREGARRLCSLALANSPDYHEIAILLGRTYAWDGRRDEARKVFQAILVKDPLHLEATLALADVELWDDKPQAALAALDNVLPSNANNTDLLLKKAKALIALKQEPAASAVLASLLDRDPGCAACIELQRGIKTNKFKHTLSLNAATDRFSDYFDPMYYASVQFGTTLKPGTVVGRLNYTNRFELNGVQPELDFYPRLWKRAYAYLNYGFTTSSLFARHRVGAEVFQSLPRSLETSLGFRYLDFGPGSAVTIYTASLGWYYKDYWFSARTFITPSEGTVSRSLNLTTRRYFADANNYLGITVGAGFSPDARRIQTNTGLEPGNNIYLLKAQKIECTFQKSIRYNMNMNIDVYYTHQELSFSYGEFVNIFGFSTGIKIRL